MSRNEGRFGTPENLVFDTPPAGAKVINEPEETTAPTDIFGMPMPTYFVDLPTRGLLYDESSPLYGKETIEIKYMTAKEEDILTDATLLQKGIAVDRVLDNLILDKNFKSTDLISTDKAALLVGARITGFGKDYNPTFRCPNCNAENQLNFNLEEMTATTTAELAEDVTQISPTNFQVKLPLTGLVVEFKVLNSGEESALAKETERKIKKNIECSPTADMLNAMILNVNGETDRFKIAQFVSTVTSRDSRRILSAAESVIPTFELSTEFECQSCTHTSTVEAPLTAEFFRPNS